MAEGGDEGPGAGGVVDAGIGGDGGEEGCVACCGCLALVSCCRGKGGICGEEGGERVGVYHVSQHTPSCSPEPW